jgi:glycosyltransferase involved in cell wall biosynthesis
VSNSLPRSQPSDNAASVGVIIPTQGRASLTAAVKSALDQTYAPSSVLIVVDGPLQLVKDISLPDDHRLQVITSLPKSGVSEARNAGIRHLDSDLVALLDDDDEWMPTKLERQVEAYREAQSGGVTHPIIACRALIQDRRGIKKRVQPIYVIQPGQRVGDYLFRRRRIFPGGAMLGSSMLLFDSVLASSTPFLDSARQHEDWDWLLRATAREDTAIFQLTDQLMRKTQHRRQSSRHPGGVDASIAWILASGDWLTTTEQANFMLCEVATRPLRNRDVRSYLALIRRARRVGTPGAKAWIAATAGVIAFALFDHASLEFGRAKLAVRSRRGRRGR